jgi:hypothetical protein
MRQFYRNPSQRRLSLGAFEQRLVNAEQVPDDTACIIRQRGKTTTMLSIVNEEDAQNENTRKWAICSITEQPMNQFPILRCLEISCRRGILKGKRTVLTSKQLCCHLGVVNTYLLRDEEMRKQITMNQAVKSKEEINEDYFEEENEGKITLSQHKQVE